MVHGQVSEDSDREVHARAPGDEGNMTDPTIYENGCCYECGVRKATRRPPMDADKHPTLYGYATTVEDAAREATALNGWLVSPRPEQDGEGQRDPAKDA